MFRRIWQKHGRVLLILAFLMAPAFPLIAMRADLPKLNIYERLSSLIIHPLADLTSSAFEGVKVLGSDYFVLVGAKKENEVLKKEIYALQQKILGLEELSSENQRLHKLLQVPPIPGMKTIAAQVIGQSSSDETWAFYINAGARQGIEPRMGVINAQGVVGTIKMVYPNSSLFIAVQDPSHRVDGVVTRSRARTLVEGKGDSLLGRLKYVDRSEDLRVGDLVVTSGMDGVFPKGLPVGWVVLVDRPRIGVMQEASLRPIVDIGHLEEVLILSVEGRSGTTVSSQ